jgi:hypothetical protein
MVRFKRVANRYDSKEAELVRDSDTAFVTAGMMGMLGGALKDPNDSRSFLNKGAGLADAAASSQAAGTSSSSQPSTLTTATPPIAPPIQPDSSSAYSALVANPLLYKQPCPFSMQDVGAIMAATMAQVNRNRGGGGGSGARQRTRNKGKKGEGGGGTGGGGGAGGNKKFHSKGKFGGKNNPGPKGGGGPSGGNTGPSPNSENG